MSSPLILIKTLEVLESVFIYLFPLAIVTSITFAGGVIYLGVFVFAVLLILKQKGKFDLLNNSILGSVSTAFLIYILFFTLSRFVNSGASEGFNTFFRCCQDFFVFLWVLLFTCKSGENQKRVKYAILLASFISIAYGMLQFVHLDFLHRQSDIERLSGFHKNPYSYAGQLIVIFFFLLANYTIAAVPCLFCILNTSERAVILAVLVGVIFYFLFKRASVTKKDLASLAILFSIPIIVTAFVNKKLLNRIKRVVISPKGYKLNVRFKLWDIALSVWKKNLLFGVGKFPTVYHEIGANFPMQVLTHAHNVYLQILVINGIVGLLAFIYLFFSILRALFKNIRSNKYAICLITIIVSFFIEGFFEYFWGDSEVRYLLIYFIGFVLGSVSAKDS